MNIKDPVESLPFVGPSYLNKLSKLDIKTIEDLLHHIPHRYLDFSKTTKIKDIKIGETITIIGNIVSIKNQATKSGRLMQIAQVEDDSGKTTVVWFSQPFITKVFYPGAKVALSGEVSWFAGKPAMFSPEYEKINISHETVHTGKIVGVYPQTEGLSSKWIKSRIKYTLDRVDGIDDFLDKKIIDKYNLYTFSEALYKIHFPKNESEYTKAKERLAFNEFYKIILKAKHKKERRAKDKNISLTIDKKKINSFIKGLPFRLTPDQKRSIEEITADLKKSFPMNRLLQGDVGSGKTVVALIASYITTTSDYKVVLLAPTQILAHQHFKTFTNLFKNYKLKIELITSGTKSKDIEGVDIFIGTHALINKLEKITKVGLLIIDEQHKFGVKQVEFLNKLNPNKLTMTATPIPRTIAQTLFSDMELSIIKNLPKNRKSIKTWLVPEVKRSSAYSWILKQIKDQKSQAYIVCPLVEESETETLKSVKSVKKEYLRLKQTFSDLKVGLLHGKMKSDEKNDVLSDFKDNKIEILVSTPVVEVGIDVPNATIIVIEAADRFGLAQLHQMRGRVGRGEKESYCLLFTENTSDKTANRLEALVKNTSGFDLAELDLKLRGAGDVLGIKQHGFGNLKIADWSQTELIKKVNTIINETVS